MRGGIRIAPRRLVPLLMACLVAGSCATTSWANPDKPMVTNKRPCGEKQLLIRVSDQEGPALDDVEISTITKDGVQLLVKTEFDQGDTCLDNSILQDPEVLCILFCREGYHCGALIPKKELWGYWELKIALARILI